MLVAEVQSMYYGCCSYPHPHSHPHPSCEKVVPSPSLKRMSTRKRELKNVASNYMSKKSQQQIQFSIIIVGRRNLSQVTLKYLRNPVGEGTKDFSTVQMFFIIVLIF